MCTSLIILNFPGPVIPKNVFLICGVFSDPHLFQNQKHYPSNVRSHSLTVGNPSTPAKRQTEFPADSAHIEDSRDECIGVSLVHISFPSIAFHGRTYPVCYMEVRHSLDDLTGLTVETCHSVVIVGQSDISVRDNSQDL